MEALEARLGYTFRDRALLENALMHSSYANENRERGLHDNERLEFLGDSILGYKSHMGAGSITSNVKSDKTHVVVTDGAERIDTGRKKVGAMLGDGVEVGCNSVLNPGSVIGRGSRVYPLSSVRGTVPAASIYKRSGDIAAQR